MKPTTRSKQRPVDQQPSGGHPVSLLSNRPGPAPQRWLSPHHRFVSQHSAITATPAHAPAAVAPGSVQPPSVAFSTGDWTAAGTFLQTRDADFSSGRGDHTPVGFQEDLRQRFVPHNPRTRNRLRGGNGANPATGESIRRELAPFSRALSPLSRRECRIQRAILNPRTAGSVNHETLVGIERAQSFGQSCGGGPPDIVRWVPRRTNPSARPLAVGP